MIESQNQIPKAESGTWQGILVMERLYVGSKSEGDYLVFKTEDGQSYRLHLKGEEVTPLRLDHLIGCHLRITGTSDYMRGFRRIVTNMDDIQAKAPTGEMIDPGMAAKENADLEGNPS